MYSRKWYDPIKHEHRLSRYGDKCAEPTCGKHISAFRRRFCSAACSKRFHRRKDAERRKRARAAQVQETVAPTPPPVNPNHIYANAHVAGIEAVNRLRPLVEKRIYNDAYQLKLMAKATALAEARLKARGELE